MAGYQKPKAGKRPTLGVVVQSWVPDALDTLLSHFRAIQPALPDWYKCPDTRSNAAAWILERCLEKEIEKVQALRYINETERPESGTSEENWKAIKADPFLAAIKQHLEIMER